MWNTPLIIACSPSDIDSCCLSINKVAGIMRIPEIVEQDGLVANLFHYLWSKDDAGNGPRVNLPHTILYASGQPLSWYFTSLKTGRVKRKHSAHMTDAHIERSFLKDKKSASDIVAYYIYTLHHEDNKAHTLASHVSDSVHDDSSSIQPATIEYFDTSGLRDFFKRCEEGRNHSGVLQRFITPKTNHNSGIRAIWSPRICLVDRRTNRYKFNDSKYSVYERAVTFDGPESFSRHDPVRGTLLAGEVQFICEEIAEHLNRVGYKERSISTLVVHLKLDSKERLWLQWCSSLRTIMKTGDSHVNVRTLRGTASAPQLTKARPVDLTTDPKVPAHMLQAGALRRMQPSHSLISLSLIPEKGFGDLTACPSCGNMVDRNRMASTTYRNIIQHYQKFLMYARLHSSSSSSFLLKWPPEHQLVQAAGGIGFGILPALMEMRKSAHMNAITHHDSSREVSDLTPKSTRCAVGLYSERDWMIPPVLQHLHPSWTMEDYERYRHDPMCMQKLIAVCETCCLTYFDYATNALELNNSLHTETPITLRPRENVDLLYPMNRKMCSKAKKRLFPIPQRKLGVGRHCQQSLSTSRKAANKESWKPIPAPAKNPQSQVGGPSTLEGTTQREFSSRADGAIISSTSIYAQTVVFPPTEDDCFDLLEDMAEDFLPATLARCNMMEADLLFNKFVDMKSSSSQIREQLEAVKDSSSNANISNTYKKVRHKRER